MLPKIQLNNPLLSIPNSKMLKKNQSTAKPGGAPQAGVKPGAHTMNHAAVGAGGMQANIMQQNQLKILELQKHLDEERQKYNLLEKDSEQKIENMTRENAELNQKILNQQNSIDVMTAEFNNMQKQKTEDHAAGEIKRKEQELQVKEKRIQLEMEQIFKQLDEQKHINFQLQDEIQQYRNNLEETKQANDDLQLKLDEAMSELEIYQGKNLENIKNASTHPKHAVQLDDDEPEVYSATQKFTPGQQQPHQAQTSKQQQQQQINTVELQHAFNEARKLIEEKDETVKQLQNQIEQQKRNYEAAVAEKRLEVEELTKQLQEKNQEFEELLHEVNNDNHQQYKEQVFDKIEQRTEETAVELKQSQFSKPLPVYHSLVNPSAKHNERQEYSLVKNENVMLREENRMMQKRLEKYESVNLQNMQLYNQISQLRSQNAQSSNADILSKANQNYKNSQEVGNQFSMEELKQKMLQIQNSQKQADKQSFMNTIKQRSIMQKSMHSRMNADKSQVDNQNTTIDGVNFNYDEVKNQENTNQPQVNLEEQQLDIQEYVDDMSIDQLKAEHKEFIGKIQEYEQKLLEFDLIKQQKETLDIAVNQMQLDIGQLKEQLNNRDQSIDLLMQQQNNRPTVATPVLNTAKVAVKQVINNLQQSDRGTQCGLTATIPMHSKEIQTKAVFDMTGRMRPALISNDGLEYYMNTDQYFEILNDSNNVIDKKYKVVQNCVVDDVSQKVDFNGTYKDNRGIFSVVHGIIDIDSLRTTDPFTNRQNFAQVYDQLQLYKKEIKRVEDENECLASALAKARKRLAQMQNKSMQEIILAENDEQAEGYLGNQDQLVQTDYSALQNNNQNYSYNNTQNTFNSQQFGNALGAALQQYSSQHQPTQYNAQSPHQNNLRYANMQPIYQPNYNPNISDAYPISNNSTLTHVARATSPTVPEYHLQSICSYTEKTCQTDLYVVPLDNFMLEKEKSNQYSKENSRLIMEMHKLKKLKQEYEQKQKEMNVAVGHIAELNKQIDDTNNQNLALKQQVIQLQSQVELMIQNKGNYSDIFVQTNQAQQEMFDNLRQRLGQKDAQIQDLQVLLQQTRENSLGQVQQLHQQIQQFKQLGDQYSQAQVNNIKADLLNQESKLVNQINQNSFTQKLFNFDEINQSVEKEFRNCLKENKKLRKAGELIKDAFITEQNKAYTLEQVILKLKNSLVVLFAHHQWLDLEIYLKKDDQYQGLENQIIQRLGGNLVIDQIEGSAQLQKSKKKVKKLVNNNQIGYQYAQAEE